MKHSPELGIVLGIGGQKTNKTQILPSKPTVQTVSVFNSIGKGQALFFLLVMSGTAAIPSHFLCCYLMSIPGNFMPELLKSLRNDFLFTLLSWPWFISNLTS